MCHSISCSTQAYKSWRKSNDKLACCLWCCCVCVCSVFAQYSTGVILAAAAAAAAAATTMATAAALSRLLPLVLLAAVIGRHGASGDGGFPIVFAETKCTQAPTWSRANDSAFRTNVLALLGGLPSAAAPTGFASMTLRSSRSGGAGRDRAFARGICFGDPPALSPQYCLRCLSVAAKKLADGCPANRDAAVWTDGCFLSFADTNASSLDEVAYRYKIVVGALGDDDESSSRFAATLAALAERLAPRAANASRMLATATVDVPRVVTGHNSSAASNSSATTMVQVHALAQCMADRPAASCGRCLQESARELAKCCWSMQGGGVATVIGYNCHLRLEVSVPITPSVVESPQSIPAPTVSVRTTGDNVTALDIGDAIALGIAMLLLVILAACLMVDALNKNCIRSGKEEEASPPAGHVRGDAAAVKAAQIVATQNADQRSAV